MHCQSNSQFVKRDSCKAILYIQTIRRIPEIIFLTICISVLAVFISYTPVLATISEEQSIISDTQTLSYETATAFLSYICAPGKITSRTDYNNRLIPICTQVPQYPGGGCFDDFGLQIQTAIFGSFSAPGREEVILDYNGCEPHVNTFGGSMLLRKVHRAWTLVRVRPRIHTGTCLKYPTTDGTDLLVCLESEMHQGHKSESVNVVLVYDNSIIERELLNFSAPNLYFSCFSGYYSATTLTSWAKVARTANQNPGVELYFQYIEAPTPSWCKNFSKDLPSDSDSYRLTMWEKTQQKNAVAAFTQYNKGFKVAKEHEELKEMLDTLTESVDWRQRNQWGREEIPLVKTKGGYQLHVTVNGALVVPFILDTGASEVQIPADIAFDLAKMGTIQDLHILPGGLYSLADGSVVQNPRVLLESLAIGSRIINNVSASIGPVNSDPLIGQNFLDKLGAWGLDNQRQILILNVLSSMEGQRDPVLIRHVQAHLKAAGYQPGAINGKLHPQTRAALREFQKTSKLSVTGELNNATLRTLGIQRP